MKMNDQQKAIMKSRIDSLNKQFQRIKDEEDRLKELKKEFDGFYAPHRDGAIIEIPEGAHVCKGRNGRVESCSLKYSVWDSCWRWFIYGVVLKDDGSEGCHRFKYETGVDLS